MGPDNVGRQGAPDPNLLARLQYTIPAPDAFHAAGAGHARPVRPALNLSQAGTFLARRRSNYLLACPADSIDVGLARHEARCSGEGLARRACAFWQRPGFPVQHEVGPNAARLDSSGSARLAHVHASLGEAYRKALAGKASSLTQVWLPLSCAWLLSWQACLRCHKRSRAYV